MTAEPQLYARRCNGLPEGGITVTRETVESVIALLSRSIVETSGDLAAGLTIRVAGGHPIAVEAPGTVERVFTFEPLPDGQHRGPAVDT